MHHTYEKFFPPRQYRLPVELLGFAASIARKLRGQLWLGQDTAHGSSHRCGVVGRDEQGVRFVFKQVRNSPDIRTDYGEP